MESRELQIDRSDAGENYCWFEMSGGGQQEKRELEKGQMKESKKVKGKLGKTWKKQSASRKNDETYGDKETSNLVTNLSAKTLTPGQISLLSRGNKFIPNNRKTDLTKVLSDRKEWERRMRLREYFFSGRRRPYSRGKRKRGREMG